MAKPKTNRQILSDIMDHSRFGHLAEIFVMDALAKVAAAVAEADPEVCDSAMVSGEAWVGVAKEIKEKLSAY